jgi:hypothetical protein
MDKVAEKRNDYGILVGKPFRKPALGRPRRAGNNKTELRKAGCEDGRRMELAYDRIQWRTTALLSHHTTLFTTVVLKVSFVVVVVVVVIIIIIIIIISVHSVHDWAGGFFAGSS